MFAAETGTLRPVGAGDTRLGASATCQDEALHTASQLPVHCSAPVRQVLELESSQHDMSPLT